MTAERLRAWFDGRSLREKRLVLAMAALAVLVLVWTAVLLPIGDGLAAARDRQAAAVLLLAQTEARVAALKALERDPPPALGAPLDGVIRARADAAGFALASVTAQGPDRIQIAIASARPGALTAWIAGLEDDGILIDTLNMTDNGDRTVSVQMSLKTRAA